MIHLNDNTAYNKPTDIWLESSDLAGRELVRTSIWTEQLCSLEKNINMVKNVVYLSDVLTFMALVIPCIHS